MACGKAGCVMDNLWRELSFQQQRKDLHARAMWFRFSAMLVAHSVLLGALVKIASSPDEAYGGLLWLIVLAGGVMSLIWYFFMERSHDIDSFLDNRIECLAYQGGIPYIKNVTDRCVTVSGGCLMYATVFVIAAVYPAVLLIRLGLGYVNLISSTPLVLILMRRLCSHCDWSRRKNDQRSLRVKPGASCSQCYDNLCTRVRGYQTHCCANCHLGGTPQQQGSQ